MKRNFLLISAILIAFVLGVNSARKILSFRGTSEKVSQAEQRLEDLKRENEALKNDLEYKKSNEFKEMEIRNRLGLVKEGETVVIVPKDDDERLTTNDESSLKKSNWEKWKELFFGT
ncbi:hypothetical protein A3A49_01540 [Candidatus Curtissbacteria bacterium RIFCSPLOWO2_01_FULL_38_11b]|uniref:Cell division protein FtsL n=1 Tax=Candidatus Curtissbacteria bacterium RIFCSPLOWO2_01_FULL_38_11b TaxID=1797725 RepID=A0A1F5H135_9BACT|nr:MAG: hypothetical protein A3A49_01540 [Candidatus Curtissbacteria bacterium RIFCSPLOWO2_01_FULL_38_11b]